MQDYIELAEKNGVTLYSKGKCQFCDANTKKGIHECIEIFNLGFHDVDFSKIENHIYRFYIVDAHALQHPEIHGRWSNHFHLTRLHLIIKYNIKWNYESSPKLSDYLNNYKVHRQNEYLLPPEILKRGTITTTDILKISANYNECRKLIQKWAIEVYNSWENHFHIIDYIAKGFLNKNQLK